MAQKNLATVKSKRRQYFTVWCSDMFKVFNGNLITN